MKIVHLRNINPQTGTINAKGGATVAYELVGTTLLYAESKCNPSETFNRKLGRKIAEGKLNKYLTHGEHRYTSKLKSVPLKGRKPIIALAETLLRS